MRRLRAKKVTLKGVERQKVVDYIKNYQLKKHFDKHIKNPTDNSDFWAKGLSFIQKSSVEQYFDYKVPSDWRNHIVLDHNGSVFGTLHYWN